MPGKVHSEHIVDTKVLMPMGWCCIRVLNLSFIYYYSFDVKSINFRQTTVLCVECLFKTSIVIYTAAHSVASKVEVEVKSPKLYMLFYSNSLEAVLSTVQCSHLDIKLQATF